MAIEKIIHPRNSKKLRANNWIWRKDAITALHLALRSTYAVGSGFVCPVH